MRTRGEDNGSFQEGDGTGEMPMCEYVRRGEWLETAAGMDRLPVPERMLKQLELSGGIREGGGKLRLHLFPGSDPGFAPEWMDLSILYEDDFVLVVNKPAGMPVHPAERGGTGSLANAVAAYYESTGQAVAVRHIHRLDADTTGPVLYAKNAFAQTVLDRQMREKKIARVYLAVVAGVPDPPSGTVNAPLGRDRHHAGRRRVSRTGVKAVTHYETVESWAGSGASLVRLRLETGRTHQIRVHMSYIGTPIYGDALYGGPGTELMRRQALHGESLLFIHPWYGDPRHIKAPLPDDLAGLIGHLRN